VILTLLINQLIWYLILRLVFHLKKNMPKTLGIVIVLLTTTILYSLISYFFNWTGSMFNFYRIGHNAAIGGIGYIVSFLVIFLGIPFVLSRLAVKFEGLAK
jgi:hypothetical protein